MFVPPHIPLTPSVVVLFDEEGLRIDIVTTHYDTIRRDLDKLSGGSAQEGHEPWFGFNYCGLPVAEELISQ